MLEGFLFWRRWGLSQKKVEALFPLVVQREWFTIGGRLSFFQDSWITTIQVLNPDGVMTKGGLIPYHELGNIEAGGRLEFCAFIGTKILVRYTPPSQSQVTELWDESLVPGGTIFFLPLYWKDALSSVISNRKWNSAQQEEQARLREQVEYALSGPTSPPRGLGGNKISFKRIATFLRQLFVGMTLEEVVACAQKLPRGKNLELVMPFDGIWVDYMRTERQKSRLQKALGSDFEVVEDYHTVRLIVRRLSRSEF